MNNNLGSENKISLPNILLGKSGEHDNVSMVKVPGEWFNIRDDKVVYAAISQDDSEDFKDDDILIIKSERSFQLIEYKTYSKQDFQNLVFVGKVIMYAVVLN